MSRHDRAETSQAGGPAEITRRLYTVSEAAAALGISRSKAYQLISDGKLASVTIGRSRRVSVTAIDEFVAKLQSEGQ